MKSKLIATALAAGLALTGWCGLASAVPISYKLVWHGDSGYRMFGGFAFDSDALLVSNLIQETDLTRFRVSFFDPTDTLLKTYDLTNQVANWNFNFDYDTRTVRQGSPNDSTAGLIIGNNGTNEWLLVADSGCTSGVVDIQLLDTGGLCLNVVDGSSRFFVEAIPEPATLALFAVGLLSLGLASRWPVISDAKAPAPTRRR